MIDKLYSLDSGMGEVERNLAMAVVNLNMTMYLVVGTLLVSFLKVLCQ